MEAATLRQHHALPTPPPAVPAHEWDWVYDDPDLAPYRASTRNPRKETPLTAFG